MPVKHWFKVRCSLVIQNAEGCSQGLQYQGKLVVVNVFLCAAMMCKSLHHDDVVENLAVLCKMLCLCQQCQGLAEL